MSQPRPVVHARVNWPDREKETKMSTRRRASEQLKDKELSQSLLDPAKVKVVKQTSVGRMKSETCAPKAVKEVEKGHSRSPKQQAATRPPRHTSSKYDFVKVRVWLGDKLDHYYVLSRFLVSRMLTVTKIPNHVAIKIALELKKLLIDNSLLDVSQTDLQANLFKLMERRGYGAEYIKRYKMMTRFHHQRIPLIILVCGAACVGKSTIATQLAQRLNLPNVLQTDMVYELLRTATDPPLATTPVWARDFSSPEELITEFSRECRIVRKGLNGDLSKAMKDGKPVIIEGFHLDPSLYLIDEETGTGTASQKDSNLAPVEPTVPPPNTTAGDSEPGSAKSRRAPGTSELGTSHALKALVENDNREYFSGKTVATPSEQEEPNTGEVSGDSSLHPQTKASDVDSNGGILGEKVDQGQSDKAGNMPSFKPPTKAIVVPIVLRMAEIDHQTLLEEWIACTSVNEAETLKEEDLIRKFQILQDYLCSFENQGLKVVDISATTFPQTLDSLHSYLLQCIERGCTPTPRPRTGP